MYDVQFLEDVRDYIYQKTGKTYLKKIRDGREDILCTCPSHKEGQENSPSCGFSKVDKNNISAGYFHCFTCGFKGNTHDVLKLVLGNQYNKEEANKVLGIEDYEFDNMLNSGFQFTIPDLWGTNYVSEKELKRYRYYTKYLEGRGISRETAEKFDIGYDTITSEITFPIRDNTGGTLAVGRRSVREKRYEYPMGFTKPLYGVFELPTLLTNRTVWVVEGPFNLWSLAEYKKCGVALLGTGTKKQMQQLLTLKTNKFVLALDGDPAGRKGIIKIGKYLQWFKKEVYVAFVPDGEDINSLTPEQFRNMGIDTFDFWYNAMINRFANSEKEPQEDLEEDLD